MEWLAAKSLLGLPRWGLFVIAALVIAAAVAVANHALDSTLDTITETAETAGATKAVNAGNEITIDQARRANDATAEIRSGASSAKYDQCVQDSDPGDAGNCERYRPHEPVRRGPADTRAASGAR